MSSDVILVFDLETIPDAAGLRQLGLFPPELSDAEGVAHVLAEREANGQSAFLPLHLQRILVVGCLFRSDKGLQIRCLGDDDTASDQAEAKRIRQFFKAIDEYEPVLVSWNGKGFDVPVLHHRALFREVTASTYWDQGQVNPGFKYNNYQNRYHHRHLDLMEQLSAFQTRGSAPLDVTAQLCGFPGKLGMSGAEVWPSYLRGETPAIAAYCETDVVNTYLVYLRFQFMRGLITAQALEAEQLLVRKTLEGLVGHPDSPQQGQHWAEYLRAWA